MPLEPIFQKAHLLLKPRTPLPEMRVEFFPFAGLTHTARLRENRLLIRVSDLLADAPEDRLSLPQFEPHIGVTPGGFERPPR